MEDLQTKRTVANVIEQEDLRRELDRFDSIEFSNTLTSTYHTATLPDLYL